MTHLHAGHARVAANLQALDDSEVGTTIVTKIEILRGRYEFLMKAQDGDQVLKAQKWLKSSEQLLSSLMIVPFNAAAGEQFDRLRDTRILKRLGRADLLIASIALANNATLATRNLRHFKQIPNLKTVNWVDA